MSASEQQRVDWFHRTEKRSFDRSTGADRTYSFTVAADATLAEILAQGYALHIPKGSARGGCFEVQTDLGVWSSPTGGRMNPRTATFRSWEQLESEDHP
jgi:hypothetical protein